jgi:hypothetical protein
MTVGSGLLVSRPRQQTTSARTRTCGRPRQKDTSADHVSKEDMWQTMLADHVNKYTWHNQMMTSVKRKLARAMSTSDISKLRHSGDLLREFHQMKCQKSRSPEGQSSEVTLSRRSEIPFGYYPDH